MNVLDQVSSTVTPPLSAVSFTQSMASPHHHSHHCHHQPPPPPPPPPPSTHCCCNHSYTCCCTQHHHPPPQSTHHLFQPIASFLSQSDPSFPTPLPAQYPKFHTHNHELHNLNQYQNPTVHRLHQQQQTQYSTIASLLSRIEALESTLHRFSSSRSHSYYHSASFFSLRDTAARIIQTHFRAFLVRRSRTLSQLKHLAFIKSSFSSLKSTFSNDPHIDFTSLSHKAVTLLLKLDPIEGDDPMIRDGKRSIHKGLIQFLDSIEGVAVKKHLHYVKPMKNVRFGQNFNKSRVRDLKYGKSGDDQSKLLQNLRDRVERISRLCKVSAEDDRETELEGVNHVFDEDGGTSVLISRRNGVSPTKNGVSVLSQGVQPRVKKNVRFAENGNISEVYGSTYEPAASRDVTWTCSDGSSSSDDQVELLENVSCGVEDVMDSSQGAEDDEEALIENGGSPHGSDGERNFRRGLKNDSRNEGKVWLQEHKENLLFSAPLPLKMENRADLMKSKGVRIVT